MALHTLKGSLLYKTYLRWENKTMRSGKWLPPTRQAPHDLHVKPMIFAACCGWIRLETCITPYEHSGSNGMSLDNARLWHSCQNLSMNFALCWEDCVVSMAVWLVKLNGPFSPWPWLMSQLTGRTRLQSAVMEDFSTKLLAALELQQVGERFALIFEPVLKNHLDPIASKLNTTIQALSAKVNPLVADSKAKDEKIAKMEQRIVHLESSIDDLEQYGRRDSVRIFGLPEDDLGTMDEKVIKLCNARMKLRPPLQVDEIAVSHRVGEPKPVPQDTNAEPSSHAHSSLNLWAGEPRSVRWPRERSCGTETQRGCKPTTPRKATDLMDDVEYNENRALLPAVFMTDDLTKARASLAYQAQVLKRNHKIQDTWVINCRIMAKDTHGRISDKIHFRSSEIIIMKRNLKYCKPILIVLVDYYCIS